jgi:hypothetical protein
MVFFSFLSARRIIGCRGKTSNSSENVMISLAVVFFFSYFPFELWCLVVY